MEESARKRRGEGRPFRGPHGCKRGGSGRRHAPEHGLAHSGPELGQLVPKIPTGGRRSQYRGGNLLAQHPQTADMVVVLVGDDDGGQLLGRDPQGFQSRGNPPGGDARVQQNMSPAAGHQGGVAAGAAGQGGNREQKEPSLSEKFKNWSPTPAHKKEGVRNGAGVAAQWAGFLIPDS